MKFEYPELKVAVITEAIMDLTGDASSTGGIGEDL